MKEIKDELLFLTNKFGPEKKTYGHFVHLFGMFVWLFLAAKTWYIGEPLSLWLSISEQLLLAVICLYCFSIDKRLSDKRSQVSKLRAELHEAYGLMSAFATQNKDLKQTLETVENEIDELEKFIEVYEAGNHEETIDKALAILNNKTNLWKRLPPKSTGGCTDKKCSFPKEEK